ncbi:ATP-binding protein [Streptomyces sp. NPDC006367]|uniref:ATP-binding protein n=1 Tax=unclassified Streptomyces TaxID=2593676 RepID=UPI0033B6AB5C
MPRFSHQITNPVTETGDLDLHHRWTPHSSVSCPAETSQISELRYRGAKLLEACLPDPHAYDLMEGDAKLLITEVATNVLVHGEAPALTLTLATSGRAVRFSITGQTKALPTRDARRCPRPTAESGRGLILVQALAAAWGADPHNGVWFTLTIPEAVSEPRALAS